MGWVVWCFWGIMVVAATIYVALYALPLPFADEWTMVGVATGRQKPTLDWFWSLHNVHRMPLPKLAYVALGELTGYDFHTMALANVLFLAAASAILLVGVQRASGGARLFQIIIPALYLHWGHQINLTWAFEVNFTLYAMLSATVLAMIASQRGRLFVPKAVGVSLLTILLSMCGTFGLIYVPLVALWLGWAGAVEWRLAESRWRALAFIAIGVLLGCVTLGYAICFPTISSANASSGALQTMDSALKFMTTGVGPIGRALRPVSSLLLCGVAVGALCILWQGFVRVPAERTRVVGLALFLGATLALALAIGFGRAGQGEDATYQSHYGILAAPAIAALFVAYSLYSQIRISRRLVVSIAIALLIITGVNDRKGLRDAQLRFEAMQDVVYDAQRGATPAELGRRYEKVLHGTPDELAGYFTCLHAARLSPYHVAEIPSQRR